MANKWGIPSNVEKYVILRDSCCVYCGIIFNENTRKTKKSWEHIINDIRINGVDNIALCCVSCNSSKGSKLLEDWLNTTYCKNKKINNKTVAQVIKNALKNKPI